MTRKENLLVEIYDLRNQIAEIKGNKIVNIEEFSQTRKFRDEAADAFYATEQGQTFKSDREEKCILLGSEYDGAESARLEPIESHLQASLGKPW